jgi:hypothetical protein
MNGTAEPYGRMAAQVQSMMTVAMRADPAALVVRAGELVGRGELDPHSAGFVREARQLVLCGGAALLSVLEAHRPGTDPYGEEICTGCGAPACRTLRLVSEVLNAYLAGRPCGVDRAEAWRRADAWFANTTAGPCTVLVEDMGEGFVTRAIPYIENEAGPLLIVDRRTGALTQWPHLPREVLVEQYRRYLRGTL